MSPLFKRVGLLAAAAALLGACDFDPTLAPELAAPGSTFTVTNADGISCFLPEIDPPKREGAAAAAAPIPVDILVVTDEEDLADTVGAVDATTTTDEDGFFTAQLTAPTRPGEHFVIAVCGGVESLEGTSLQAAADADGIDSDGVLIDVLRVSQTPLTIALDDNTVKPGDTVTATFNRCQAENDFGEFSEGGVSSAAEPDFEELATDYPDLAVFLDGVLVDTIEGTERYPTGTVDVPVKIDAIGTHEIKGICTYQTFRFDLDYIAEMLADDDDDVIIPPLEGVGAAAIDYPVVVDPITLDEATTTAAAPVVVAAGPAVSPVVAAPQYTG